jgi:hypothetical protein
LMDCSSWHSALSLPRSRNWTTTRSLRRRFPLQPIPLFAVSRPEIG